MKKILLVMGSDTELRSLKDAIANSKLADSKEVILVESITTQEAIGIGKTAIIEAGLNKLPEPEVLIVDGNPPNQGGIGNVTLAIKNIPELAMQEPLIVIDSKPQRKRADKNLNRLKARYFNKRK